MIILETIFIIILTIGSNLAPALLGKAVFDKNFSFTAYCIAVAIILTEEISRIAYDDILLPPRIFSQLPGAIYFLILTIIITKIISIAIKSKTSWRAIISGSLTGTIGIFVLTSIFNKDMQPLYPLSSSNPLFGIVDKFIIDEIVFWSMVISLGILGFRLAKRSFQKELLSNSIV